MVSMSVDDIKWEGRLTLSTMGRWEPGTETRLQNAALALFTELGFQNVTVADIAARANVSERTFFRYFPTKEDVLFGDGDRLLTEIITALRSAPADAALSVSVTAAMTRLTELFQPERTKHRQRATVIAAEPALRERDLLKQSAWASAIADELTHRNITPVRAAALAGAATAGFRAAFNGWLSDRSKTPLSVRVDGVLEQLAKDLT
jgi:AcrR family transcriptional regulator